MDSRSRLLPSALIQATGASGKAPGCLSLPLCISICRLKRHVCLHVYLYLHCSHLSSFVHAIDRHLTNEQIMSLFLLHTTVIGSSCLCTCEAGGDSLKGRAARRSIVYFFSFINTPFIYPLHLSLTKRNDTTHVSNRPALLSMHIMTGYLPTNDTSGPQKCKHTVCGVEI